MNIPIAVTVEHAIENALADLNLPILMAFWALGKLLLISDHSYHTGLRMSQYIASG